MDNKQPDNSNNDLRIVKIEKFNVDMMENLLSCDKITSEVKRNLRAYKKLKKDGNSVQVIYEYGKELKSLKIGRLYPQKGIGLQNFPSDVRSALSSDYYFDLDMINSQPVLLLQLSQKNSWNCDRLKEYVLQRSEKLQEIMEDFNCDRDNAKQIILSIMFGEFTIKKNMFLSELKNELSQIQINIVNSNPNILKLCSKKQNIAGSVVANILQDMEFKILEHIDTVLQNHNRSMDVYIHDGGLIQKLENEKEFPSELIKICEDSILEKFGYSIRLAIKPMKHSFEFKHKLLQFGLVYKDEYLKTKEDFEKDHFYCSETESICTITPNGIVHNCITKAKITFASFNFTKIKDNKIHTFSFIGEWLNDPDKFIIDKIIFDPSLPFGIINNCFNTFKGLRGSIYDLPINPINRENILQRFQELILINSSKNPIYYLYHINWLALLIQFPYIIPLVAIILINTKQGSGKDTEGNFIGSKVIGDCYFKNIVDIENELLDKHSIIKKECLFMKLEEANGFVNRKHNDIIKNLITGTESNVNEKNIKQYKIKTYPHIIATTNNPVPFKVEEDDRRFCIFYTSSDRVGDTQWWKETHRLFDLPEAGAVVYQYLSSIDISNFDPSDFPKTEYHQNLTETEIPSEVLFLRECDPFNDISSQQLYNLYRDYCTQRELTPKSLIHFSRSITPMISQCIITKRKTMGIMKYSKNAS